MKKTKLSVNLNKIALLRNSRGIGYPDIVDFAKLAIDAGCDGITLHPRVDARHAKLADIVDLAAMQECTSGAIELNIEGSIRDDLMDAIEAQKVSQYTVVPVRERELTTERGWDKSDDSGLLHSVIQRFLSTSTQVSVFVDPDIEMVEYICSFSPGAIELHTKNYANAFLTSASLHNKELDKLRQCAKLIRSCGVKVNLGHDLNIHNVGLIVKEVAPDEVSIGHSLITESVFSGMSHSVRNYNKLMYCNIKDH